MKFKGKSFIAIVLTPEQPFTSWFQEIDRIIARSPGFFIDRPIVLDMRGTSIPIEDLEELLAGLAQRSVRVMGIDGVAGSRLKPGMPPSFSGGRLTADVEVPSPAAATSAGAVENAGDKASMKSDAKPRKANAPETGEGAGQQAADDGWAPVAATESNSIVITEPVRSGQSILHPDGDVTIIGSVSSGAEIIAGGSIHIYGALRGRALAGVAGKDNARIFCSKLDAELVSINGLYKVADDFDGSLRNAPAQIRFENETLVFEGLN